MQPTQEAITGNEEQGDQSSPYQALVQFYCAFNTRDMRMMAEHWAQSDDIAMDNPLGGIHRGWNEVQAIHGGLSNRKSRGKVV
jgi:limonene-1,2-epoxide hydrolase